MSEYFRRKEKVVAHLHFGAVLEPWFNEMAVLTVTEANGFYMTEIKAAQTTYVK